MLFACSQDFMIFLVVCESELMIIATIKSHHLVYYFVPSVHNYVRTSPPIDAKVRQLLYCGFRIFDDSSLD